VARGPLLGLGALLLVGGGGALGYGMTRKPTGGMTSEASDAMGAAIAELDAAIKTTKEKVGEKARTLSGISESRSSVGTNEETTRERVGKEVAFKPEPDEVIELAQRPKAGGDLERLLILPMAATAPAHRGAPGDYFELAGTKALVTTTSPVSALDAKSATTTDGFLTVARTLPLQPAIDKLVAAGLSGTLVLGAAGTLTVGTPPATGETREKAIESHPGAKFIVTVPSKTGGMPMPIVGAGAGGAGLGLLLVLAGLMSKKKQAEAVTGATMTSGQQVTLASTPPGASIAGGTPSQSYAPSGMSDTVNALSLSAANIDAGQQIGRWQIIRRIGSGGMADVFLAHAKGEAGFEKQVALKVMHGHLARNERAVAHFLDEARLAARVQHVNVVAIQDLGKIGNDYVIVMDYVDGVDLERLLACARAGDRPVPIEIGLGIMCRICDGLHAAHTATAPDGTALGIIHRDVKSANVLISKQGAVKVVDFGIAKAATQAHFTIAGETKGTPSMMAPEQRVGELVDVRADVYSVAAVGYEVITGHGVNLDLAALAHLGVENWPHLPRPSTLRQGMPPELDDILLGAMSFERDKRPASCAVFESTFERVMKKYNLSASDKDIARWAEGEMAILQRMAPPPDPLETKVARST